MGNSPELQKARDFLRTHRGENLESIRPVYHATGGVGWINDPNGFSTYQGDYHLFFQHYPYARVWGPTHWGHLRTRDFLHWEQLPTALAPDSAYDAGGCFSGSAVEMPDGRQLLLYTGMVRTESGEIQTQCIAIGDGINYDKSTANPILHRDHLPTGGSPVDFRDPKIWREGECYYMVVGNRAGDGSGSILLYTSTDGISWQFTSKLDENRGQYGSMWECPDLFALDTRHVLLVSAQSMQASPDGEFHPGNTSVALLGHYDADQGKFQRECAQPVDYGTDFYAPQTLETPDGRRVMIAWMQNWETAGFLEGDLPFHGQMTVPRQLTLRGERLCQTPVDELYAVRGEILCDQALDIGGLTEIPGLRGRVLDLELTLSHTDSCHSFTLLLARDATCVTTVRYDRHRRRICVDRTADNFAHDMLNYREFPVHERAEVLQLRLLLDRYSLEIFVNGGQEAASFVLYAPLRADGIALDCDGHAHCVIRAWPLEL